MHEAFTVDSGHFSHPMTFSSDPLGTAHLQVKSRGNICFLLSLRAQRAPLAAMCHHGHLHVEHNKLLSLSQTDRQTDRQARLQASQNNKPEKL